MGTGKIGEIATTPVSYRVLHTWCQILAMIRQIYISLAMAQLNVGKPAAALEKVRSSQFSRSQLNFATKSS